MRAQDKKVYLILGAVVIATAMATGITVGIVVNRRKRTKELEVLLARIARGQGGDSGKNSAWDMMWYKQNPQGATLSKAELNTIADQIEDAKGTFSDNEDKAYAAFQRVQNWYDLSGLSTAFYERHKKPLYTYLASFMDNSSNWGTFGADETNWMEKINDWAKNLSQPKLKK